MTIGSNVFQALGMLYRMPRVSIDLKQADSRDNDPFFGAIVQRFYSDAVKRHARYFVIPQMAYGVAVCKMPESFDEYFMMIDASARRNQKKSIREGCSFKRIAFNDHLGEIEEIRKSADVRQGRKMPENYRNGIVDPNCDPVSNSSVHDYPYFGVFHDDKLIAYGSCLVAGELCMIEHILGHAEHLQRGVVPQLIIGIASYIFEHYRTVRYYAYGTYFGGGESLRRFKRKFGFLPHKVDWLLSRSA